MVKAARLRTFSSNSHARWVTRVIVITPLAIALLAVSRWLVAYRTASLLRSSVTTTSSGYRVRLSRHDQEGFGHESNKSVAQPLQPIYIPYRTVHTGSDLAAACVGFSTYHAPNLSAYRTELRYAQYLWTKYADLPKCYQQTDTATYIMKQWVDIVEFLLARPSLSADPKTAIINVPEALPINALRLDRLTRLTPFGPITFVASGRTSVTVDPSTAIYHLAPSSLWTAGGDYFVPHQTGKVTATVIERWTGYYLLDGEATSLPPLTVTGNSISLTVRALVQRLIFTR